MLPFYEFHTHVFVLCVTDVDEPLSKHIAHLFIRDPVSLFSEKINQDDEKDTDHFEVDTQSIR